MTASFRTIGFPDNLLAVESGSFDLQVRHAFSDTIFNTFVRAAGPVLHLWACQLKLIKHEREGWQEWQSFKARLSGQVNLFTVPAPANVLPLGEGAGYAEDNPAYSITGVTITGTTIRTGSVTALIEQATARYAQSVMMNFGDDMAGEVVLRHGDKFGLGGNLYIVTGNVTADDDGIARVPFRAPLWKGAKVGDLVNFRNPTCRMQFKTPNEGPVDLSAPEFGDVTFAAVEVPYA